jgi:hypothetical protein
MRQTRINQESFVGDVIQRDSRKWHRLNLGRVHTKPPVVIARQFTQLGVPRLGAPLSAFVAQCANSYREHNLSRKNVKGKVNGAWRAALDIFS